LNKPHDLYKDTTQRRSRVQFFDQTSNPLVFKIHLDSGQCLPFQIGNKLNIASIESHTAVLHKEVNQVHIFGGYINQTELSNSLFTLDLDTCALTYIAERPG